MKDPGGSLVEKDFFKGIEYKRHMAINLRCFTQRFFFTEKNPSSNGKGFNLTFFWTLKSKNDSVNIASTSYGQNDAVLSIIELPFSPFFYASIN